MLKKYLLCRSCSTWLALLGHLGDTPTVAGCEEVLASHHRIQTQTEFWCHSWRFHHADLTAVVTAYYEQHHLLVGARKLELLTSEQLSSTGQTALVSVWNTAMALPVGSVMLVCAMVRCLRPLLVAITNGALSVAANGDFLVERSPWGISPSLISWIL